MTILSEVQKWAEKLPVWQQHAGAVLYERPTPSADDLEDILALLRDAHQSQTIVSTHYDFHRYARQQARSSILG